MNAVAEDQASFFKISRRESGLPSQLLGTHRVLQRWAATVGDGTTDLAWQELVRARMPPLDDQCAIVVDQLILRAPTDHRRLAELWYRRPDNDTADVARALCVRKADVPIYWHSALRYFRDRFTQSPLSALRRLAQTDPTDSRISLAN